jgi:hypothetical protein
LPMTCMNWFVEKSASHASFHHLSWKVLRNPVFRELQVSA